MAIKLMFVFWIFCGLGLLAAGTARAVDSCWVWGDPEFARASRYGVYISAGPLKVLALWTWDHFAGYLTVSDYGFGWNSSKPEQNELLTPVRFRS